MAKKPFRLSPNEEATIIKKEKERRRKLRLQQVREQEKAFAQRLRKQAKDKKDKELKVLAENLQRHWQDDQHQKEKLLETVYTESLKLVGEGHRAADDENPEESERMKLIIASENEKRANERHNTALRDMQEKKKDEFEKENAQIFARKTALELERARAAHMASLPPPKEDPLETMLKQEQMTPVTLTSADGFSSTQYHFPSGFVEKAEPHEQEDARKAAVEEEERMKEETKGIEQEAKERHEKAILRHKHAKEKVDLEQDFKKLMVELGHMEQIDRRRRQKVLNKIPHKVFQPPHRRLIEKQEHEQDLEEAFEDMYMAKTDYAGDLTLALEPQAPATDPTLDLTVDSEHLEKVDDQEEKGDQLPGSPEKKAGMPGDDEAGEMEEELPAKDDEVKQDETDKVDPKRESLRKLMTKIKSQREEWVQKSSQESLDIGGDRSRDVEPGRRDNAEQPEREEDGWVPERQGLQPTDRLVPVADHLHPSMEPADRAPSQPAGRVDDAAVRPDEPILAGSSTLLHPYEQASLIRSKQTIELEQRQEEQRKIMEKQELQRRQIEQQIQRDRIAQQELQAMLDENRQRILESRHRMATNWGATQDGEMDAVRQRAENEHRRMIHEHQQKLLLQQRQTQYGISAAKVRLQERRKDLMNKYPHLRLPNEQPPSMMEPPSRSYFPPHDQAPMMDPARYPSSVPMSVPPQGFFQPPTSQYMAPPSIPTQPLPTQVPMLPPQLGRAPGRYLPDSGMPQVEQPQPQAGVLPHEQQPYPLVHPQEQDLASASAPDEREPSREVDAAEQSGISLQHDISISREGIKSTGIHAKRQEQLAKQKEFLERQRQDLLRQQEEQQKKMEERQRQLQEQINRQQLELQLAQRFTDTDDVTESDVRKLKGPPPVHRLPPSESIHPHELSTIEEADTSRDSDGRPESRQDGEAVSAKRDEEAPIVRHSDVPNFAGDVGRGILSYPSSGRMPYSMRDSAPPGLVVKTDGRFTLQSLQPSVVPRVSHEDSVSSGSIVSDSMTSGEIDPSPRYPSTSMPSSDFSRNLTANLGGIRSTGIARKVDIHSRESMDDSKPLDPIYFQRSKVTSSDSESSPEASRFFPLPKSSGSTNEEDSQGRRDAVPTTTTSTFTVGAQLKDTMLKSLNLASLPSSDDDTTARSRFDSFGRGSDKEDDSVGSFRPLPEALSDYSLSSPSKGTARTIQSLGRPELDSTASSSPQKSLTFSPARRRHLYTLSSQGDTLSEHSFTTQESLRSSPTKSRFRDSLQANLSGRSDAWTSGKYSFGGQETEQSSLSGRKWRDTLSLGSTPQATASLVQEGSPPGNFRGLLEMTGEDRDAFRPPSTSPTTPEHEETKFYEFASPAKSKKPGDPPCVDTGKQDSSKKTSTSSGKIFIERPTAMWEYGSSEEDVETMRANMSQQSSIPIPSDASLSQYALTETENEGSICSSAVKAAPLPTYMQIHSPIKPSIDNLDPSSEGLMRERGAVSWQPEMMPETLRVDDDIDPSDELKTEPVIISGAETSEGESQENVISVSRYDRLIEESRRLREKHLKEEEEEKKRLTHLSVRYQEMKEALENPVLAEEDEEDESKESGILEEPNLTLLSIETSSSVGEDLAESLMSFEQHENHLVAESILRYEIQNSAERVMRNMNQPTMESFMTQDGEIDTISSGTFGDSPMSEGRVETGSADRCTVNASTDSEQVSLQDAFAKRKQAFIEASKKREKEAKEKAKQVAKQTDMSKIMKKTTKTLPSNAADGDSTEGVRQELNVRKEEVKKKHVQFSATPEILSKPKPSPTKNPTKAAIKMKTGDDRKMAEKEMKERNLRLYNRLEEVKVKKTHQKRQESYAQNREKAKEFQKKTLEMLKKKANKS
ncbi:uncharacterized protein LOC144442044 [Glandiceps talaboti]